MSDREPGDPDYCHICDNWDSGWGCIDGDRYTYCSSEDCYGMCEYVGACQCERCHG